MLVLVKGACQDTWKEWRNKALCAILGTALWSGLWAAVVLHLTSALLDTESSSRSHWPASQHLYSEGSHRTLICPAPSCFHCSCFYWLLSTLLLSEAWFLMPSHDFYIFIPAVFILGVSPFLILLPTPISLCFAFKLFDSVTPHCHFLSWVPDMFLDFSLWVNWSLSILLSLANGINDQNHEPVSHPFISTNQTATSSHWFCIMKCYWIHLHHIGCSLIIFH